MGEPLSPLGTLYGSCTKVLAQVDGILCHNIIMAIFMNTSESCNQVSASELLSEVDATMEQYSNINDANQMTEINPVKKKKVSCRKNLGNVSSKKTGKLTNMNYI